MCRLLGISSATETSISKIPQVLDSFVKLSQRHNDGWGIASLSEIAKAPYRALDSAEFWNATEEITGKDLVLHFRRASCVPIKRHCDTHPWRYETRLGTLVCAHNGHIFKMAELAKLVSDYVPDAPFYHTDSARFFNLVVAQIDRGMSLPKALIEATRLLEKITTYVALNCIILARDGLWAMQAANPTMDDWEIPDPPSFRCFNLLEKTEADKTIVASNGWQLPDADWQSFSNRQIRHYQNGKLLEVYDLPAWNPIANPYPDEALAIKPI